MRAFKRVPRRVSKAARQGPSPLGWPTVSDRQARRDLNLLAAGLALSTAGDAAALVALLLRLQPHGSAWVAGLLAAELIPYVVLAPLTGRVVDRFETRRVLLIALAGQAVLCVPLALA